MLVMYSTVNDFAAPADSMVERGVLFYDAAVDGRIAVALDARRKDG